MGKSFPGTKIGKTFAARGAQFQESEMSRSQRRDVVDFGQAVVNKLDYDFGYGGPDLSNAVSTLVVRALAGEAFAEIRPKYWARSVRVITLPEVYNHYKEEATFETIYDVWLEGAVVIRKTPKRGNRAGDRGRRR